MNHTETLTRYIANFVDELVCSGLTHVVISPGSRSTPLAVLCSEHEKIKEWVLVDERSAAYFALGIAKQTQKPVALICTSGTAAANYFPAIVEAAYARVPLLVLTADRPHELRGIGASQTINQINMYGQFVKDFTEMALPENTPSMIRYVRNRAARAVQTTVHGNPGPVHLNFPFREPLLPDLTLKNLWGTRAQGKSYNQTYMGKQRLNDVTLEDLIETFQEKRDGLIVCGPQVNEQLAEKITILAKRLQVPVLADPLSQLRAGRHDKQQVISMYDTILRDETRRETLKPDYIIRFGAMPISKHYLFYIQAQKDVLQLVVEEDDTVREPTNHASEYVFADGAQLCDDLISRLPTNLPSSSWLKQWQQLEETIKNALPGTSDGCMTEGEAVKTVLDCTKDDSIIFVSNSMPVRDMDSFFTPTNKQIYMHANRGVSGIDGIVSSALGVAAVADKQVTLVIGDLSFYHDLNSLLIAKHYHIKLTILLINNNGGGIFSFLPQAKEEKHFEALFGTPLDIAFEKAVTMYGANYTAVENATALTTALETADITNGVSVIEVQTDRTENVTWHRKLWETIEERLHVNDESFL